MMTFSEALGLLWRQHVKTTTEEMQHIEIVGRAGGWSEAEVKRQMKVIFEVAMDEFLRRGWVTTEHFMHLNRNGQGQKETVRE